MTAFSDGERTDPVGGKVVRRVGAGVLYRDDRFAHLYWQNLLAVDPANELSAEALIAEADRLFAGLAIRHLLVADARSADRLRPGFRDAGYKEVVLVTMPLRRTPDRRPPAAELVELSAAQLRPTVQAYAKSGPRDDDAVREMCRLKVELGRNGVRFLGAIVDGEVAGWCEVRGIETRGQVHLAPAVVAVLAQRVRRLVRQADPAQSERQLQWLAGCARAYDARGEGTVRQRPAALAARATSSLPRTGSDDEHNDHDDDGNDKGGDGDRAGAHGVSEP